MELYLFLLIGILLFVAIIWIVRVNRQNNKLIDPLVEEPANPDPGCCGAHEVCEFDAIKANPELVEYFEDEDLDRLQMVKPTEFTDEQIDQLREVLYTLKTHEIKNWLLSLERRRIYLPDFLKEEARDLQINS
jgi:hypothetical protein